MKKPILFLDIDGVLATNKEYNKNRHKFWNKNPEFRELNVPYPYNVGCVKILNEILEETDADIVLSSDWKLHWNLGDLDKIFKLNGITKSPIDVTGDHPIALNHLEKNRFNEIKIYIQDKDIKNYVIVDDLRLDIYSDRFVRTKDSEGLKQTGVKDKILKFFKNVEE